MEGSNLEYNQETLYLASLYKTEQYLHNFKKMSLVLQDFH